MTGDVLKDHPELVVGTTAKVRKAVEIMTKTRFGVIVVTGKGGRLAGLITDIDIRRGLLKGFGLEAPVTKVMNAKPITLSESMSEEAIAEVFRGSPKSYIPLVDKAGRLKALVSYMSFASIPKRYPNWVVLMAGGMGKRLLPLTQDTPKPMLRVGDKPIIELLLDQMRQSGFVHFVFTVNYLASQIKAHFGDGSKWGVQIEYVHEDRPLGTAGALSLINRRFEHPVLVANGDVLTKVDFTALLEFHKAEKGLATLCVKQHEVQVPYGVIELDEHRLQGFVEKPIHRFLINAGIYVLEPQVLSLIPKGKPCDMPELLSRIRKKRPKGVACFPIQEYWLDIGGPEQFQRASLEFGDGFR